jgi:hypothetical protein
MKQILLLLSICFLTITGCKRDECESTNCLNGGICVDGTCECPAGYNGTNCEIFDQCFNVTCLNGGNCVNGSCNCPEGFSGSDCSQQVAPQKIRVSKIEVLRFPATDNGAGWDLSSGPEIYPEIVKGTTLLWSSPNYYENADPSSTYSFNISPALDLNEPKDRYIIRLYDYDSTGSDDYMGGIQFTPYESFNKFPSTLDIDANGNVAFRIHLTYIF